MSELKVNKVSPQSGTDFTLGDSGDTFTVPSGATLTVAGTFTQTGAQTFDGGVDIDNFNINGTTITLSSGDMTLDVAGDIILDADGGEILFHDATTAMGHISMASSNITLKSLVSDKDIIFQGNDGGAGITALTLDMSAAGAATFNNAITASGIIKTDDTTNATSTTDGSLQTDGGLSVVLDAVIGDDLKLLSDAAVLSFGANSEITLSHVADVGLALKHTATADDKPIVLTLQTGETDIAANDVIGTINFQAPDEGAGTDALLVAAGIAAISEGDFSASNNATSLVFKTGASETATEKMRVTSAGRVKFTRPRSNTLGDTALSIEPSDTVVGVGFRMESTNNDLVIEKSAPSGSEAEILRIRSGGGIALGGAGDANTLNDYEEGSFTTTFSSGIGASLNAFTYTKIGNFVILCGKVTVNSTDGASTQLTMTLPFNSSGRNAVTVNFVSGQNVGDIGLVAYTNSAGTMQFYSVNDNANEANHTHADISNGDEYYMTVTYRSA